jgi:hypothetical protein
MSDNCGGNCKYRYVCRCGDQWVGRNDYCLPHDQSELDQRVGDNLHAGADQWQRRNRSMPDDESSLG